MITTITNGYTKFLGSTPVPSKNTTEYTVRMAKNEGESCTIGLFSEEKVEGLTLEVVNSGERDLKTELFLVHLMDIKGELWPDPLEPLRSAFTVEAGVCTSLSLRIYTTTFTESGDDTVVLQLKDVGGTVIFTYNVNVHIWSFAYPERQSMATSVGLYHDCIAKQYGMVQNPRDPIPEEHREEHARLCALYYEFMLEKKISPIILPYDILDPRCDKFMSDPRQTSFQVPDRVDDETLAKYYEKLKSNPEWLKKAYLYPIDEPTRKDMLDGIAENVERYKRICPEIKVGTAFFCNIGYDEKRDQVEFLTETLSMLVPKVCNFNPVNDGWGRGIPTTDRFPSFADRMKAFKNSGKHLWSYVCWEPEKPYANVLINEPGSNHRILFWQQYLIGSEGFLYWCVNEWNCCADPWTDGATVKWLSNEVFGDGNLTYPGHRVGYDGACGSLRLDAITDGVEDHELLTLASKYLGDSVVELLTSAVTRSVADYTFDPAVFDSVRATIGELVEREINN